MYGIIWQLEPDEGPATLCRWYLPLCSGLVLIFFHTKTDNRTQATARDRCATDAASYRTYEYSRCYICQVNPIQCYHNTNMTPLIIFFRTIEWNVAYGCHTELARFNLLICMRGDPEMGTAD